MSALDFTRRLVRRWRGGGWRWLTGAISDRFSPAHPAFLAAAQSTTAGRAGLEIGGPSAVFSARGILPIYPGAARVDNVNFSSRTAWEKGLRDGGEFRFHRSRSPGTQWLREAVALYGIADETWHFVLSSHCLEHVANPLRALHEWRRVTRLGGHLILVLPDPEKSFDHRRPVTTLEHLCADLAAATSEADETHVAEALALHDLGRDAGVGSPEEFQDRTRHNAENRCLHHHIFDLSLLNEALTTSGWRVLAVERVRPVHLVALAQKSTP